LTRQNNTISSRRIVRLNYCRKNSCLAIWLFIMPLAYQRLNAIHAHAQLPMPFKKLFLGSRKILVVWCSHTWTTEMQVMLAFVMPKWEDIPRSPRSLSWKKSSALKRKWHKPECIVVASACFANIGTKELNTTGRLCFSLTICMSMVEVFNSILMQLP
jgi:hypothetical protein